MDEPREPRKRAAPGEPEAGGREPQAPAPARARDAVWDAALAFENGELTVGARARDAPLLKATRFAENTWHGADLREQFRNASCIHRASNSETFARSVLGGALALHMEAFDPQNMADAPDAYTPIAVLQNFDVLVRLTEGVAFRLRELRVVRSPFRVWTAKGVQIAVNPRLELAPRADLERYVAFLQRVNEIHAGARAVESVDIFARAVKLQRKSGACEWIVRLGTEVAGEHAKLFEKNPHHCRVQDAGFRWSTAAQMLHSAAMGWAPVAHADACCKTALKASQRDA